MAPSQQFQYEQIKKEDSSTNHDNEMIAQIHEETPVLPSPKSHWGYDYSSVSDNGTKSPAMPVPTSREVKISSFTIVQSHYSLFANDSGEETYINDLSNRFPLSYSSSDEYTYPKKANGSKLLDFSQSLPHIGSNDRKTTNFLTSMNVFCLIQGVSIFALPFVTVKCFVPVIFLTIYLGIVNWFTAYLLVECQHQISESRPGVRKRVHPTYIDIGKAAFKNHGELLMKLVTTTIVVSGIAYFILLGQITFDTLHSKLPLTTQHWIVVWAALVIPSLYIDRVSVMAWFSMISTVSITLVVFLISGVFLSNYKNWNMDNINWGFDLEYFFLAYGIIQNSFFVHLVVPSIEGSMVKPENCHQVMAVSFAVNTGFKIIFQAMAALTFGINIQQSVTSNIDSPIGIAFLVNALTAINLYCGFPIIFCVLFEMMDTYILPSFKLFDTKSQWARVAWKTLSRLLVIMLITFVSVSIPQFGLVVSFLGNFRSTVAAMLLPLIFYIKLKWNYTSLTNRVAVLLTLVAAVLTGTGACYFSLRSIISSFHNQ